MRSTDEIARQSFAALRDAQPCNQPDDLREKPREPVILNVGRFREYFRI